jgi:hypothetical protein
MSVLRLLAAMFLVFLVGAFGCTTIGSDLRSWRGRPIDDYVLQNGAPTRTIELSSGGRAYTWVRPIDGRECWISFSTDTQGIIQSGSWENCPVF